jgi:hypothetical protein
VRVAAEPTVARGKCSKVDVAHRVGLDAARRDPIRAQQRRAGEERRLAPLVADTDQRVRLTVEQGLEVRVRIGDVKERDVAERLDIEELL